VLNSFVVVGKCHSHNHCCLGHGSTDAAMTMNGHGKTHDKSHIP
jgi:hypothetical protein